VAATKASQSNPKLIILDNHDSRFDATMRDEAFRDGVILLTLPPNTTYKLQPLDLVCHGVLKHLLHKKVDEAQLHGTPVTLSNRVRFLAEPWKEAMSEANIRAGFASMGLSVDKAGAVVIDRKAVELHQKAHVPAFAASVPEQPKQEKKMFYTEDGQLKIPNLENAIPPDLDDVLVTNVLPTAAADAGTALILSAQKDKQNVEERWGHASKASSRRRKTKANGEGKQSRKRKRSPASESKEPQGSAEPAAEPEQPTRMELRPRAPRQAEPAPSEADEPDLQAKLDQLELRKGKLHAGWCR
jgi:hypothetical protein